MLALLLFRIFLSSLQPSGVGAAANNLFGSSFGIPGSNASFDYIVVGGGTAGLLMAARLAEQQSGQVAVVEAGTFYELGNGNHSELPFDAAVYTSKARDDWHPLIDWGYVTEPQTHAYDTEMHYARGKCLGGSSARNFLVYQRGTKASYRQWADLVGDESYTFDSLLPFFNKSICFTPAAADIRFANSTPLFDTSVLGDCSGPLSVTYPNYAHQFASWATKGLEALGLPRIHGFQSGELLGHSYNMFSMQADSMKRDSSETSFLHKALDYHNHIVYPLTAVRKITFDTHKRATGVEVETQGMRYHLAANKEVIVSAGVFGSPQLLMVSGIGPAKLLKNVNIPLIADRPGVGQNLQDHLYFGPAYRVNGQTGSSMADPGFAAHASAQFLSSATGMLTNPSTDVLGWEKVPEPLRRKLSGRTRVALDAYPNDWPEIEYLAVSAYLGFQNKSGGNDPHDGYNYASLAAALSAPRSRGEVKIKSADISVPPAIDPKFFSDPADIEVAIAAYKRVRAFWKSPVMRPFRLDDKEAFPGLEKSSNHEIADIIKRSFNTLWHGAGTCSMGKPSDPMAVVDTQGRVYGVQNLRVVDISVFPLLPPGHPTATIYAVAEKIACYITGCTCGE